MGEVVLIELYGGAADIFVGLPSFVRNNKDVYKKYFNREFFRHLLRCGGSRWAYHTPHYYTSRLGKCIGQCQRQPTIPSGYMRPDW